MNDIQEYLQQKIKGTAFTGHQLSSALEVIAVLLASIASSLEKIAKKDSK